MGSSTVVTKRGSVTKSCEIEESTFYKEGETHFVGMNLQVHYISNIDTVNQEFEVGFFLNYEWKPSKEDVIEFENLKAKGLQSEFVPSYLPDFRFPNLTETSEKDLKTYLDGSHYTLLKHGEKDTRGALTTLPKGLKYLIAARLSVRGKFSEPFELYNFPLDCQDLKVSIISTATTDKQILVPHFRRNAFVVINQEFSDLPEWTLHPPICDFNLSDKAKSARGYQFSSMTLLAKVSRNFWSHVIRTVILIVSIATSQLFVYAVESDRESLADRLSISFTLVLTALVFMFVIETRLPKVSFLTLLDKYVYSTFFIMMFSTAASSIVTILPGNEMREDWNKIALYANSSILGILQVWFLISVVIKRKEEIRKLSMTLAEAKKIESIDVRRSQLQVKSEGMRNSHYSYNGQSLVKLFA